MAGVALAVLAIALVVGFLGRLVMPGRHGLLSLMLRDVRFVRRFVMDDVELRWEMGASLLGTVVGFLAGRAFDAFAATTSSAPAVVAVVGSVLFTAIAVVSGVIERSRFTRKLGIHRSPGVHA
jgi:hypothetical protein